MRRRHTSHITVVLSKAALSGPSVCLRARAPCPLRVSYLRPDRARACSVAAGCGVFGPLVKTIFTSFRYLQFTCSLFSHTHFILVYSSPFLLSQILSFFLRVYFTFLPSFFLQSVTHICGFVSFLPWRDFLFWRSVQGFYFLFSSLSLCFPLYAEGTSLTSSLRYQEVASSVSYFLNQLVVDGLVMMMSVIFLAETTTSPTLYTH